MCFKYYIFVKVLEKVETSLSDSENSSSRQKKKPNSSFADTAEPYDIIKIYLRLKEMLYSYYSRV